MSKPRKRVTLPSTSTGLSLNSVQEVALLLRPDDQERRFGLQVNVVVAEDALGFDQLGDGEAAGAGGTEGRGDHVGVREGRPGFAGQAARVRARLGRTEGGGDDRI